MITANECAHEVLDVVPSVMRVMRAEFRSHRGNDLSVPQFRALSFINRNSQASLSKLAEHLGLTLPSTSKLIDGLVGRLLVAREQSSADRRCIKLTLTKPGHQLLDESFQATLACFVERLAAITDDERSVITNAMQLLKPLFADGKRFMSEG